MQGLPLCALAFELGNDEAAQLLVRAGADPRCLLRWSFLGGPDGRPLADGRRGRLARLVNVFAGAAIDPALVADDEAAMTLLHYLSMECMPDEAGAVLGRLSKAALNRINGFGDTALLVSLKVIRALASGGGDGTPGAAAAAARRVANHLLVDRAEEVDLRVVDRRGDDALIVALAAACPTADPPAQAGQAGQAGHEAAVTLLAEQMIDRKGGHPGLIGSCGNSHIMVALKRGLPLLAATMVSQLKGLEPDALAAAVDARDRECGDSALVVAIKVGAEGLAEMLLDYGADFHEGGPPVQWGPSLYGPEDTPMAVALRLGLVSCASKMVPRSAAFLTQPDSRHATPLMLAIRAGAPALAMQIAVALVERQEFAALAYQDRINGETPLLLAARANMLELACFLVDHGADVRSANKAGLGLLHSLVFSFFAPQMCGFDDQHDGRWPEPTLSLAGAVVMPRVGRQDVRLLPVLVDEFCNAGADPFLSTAPAAPRGSVSGGAEDGLRGDCARWSGPQPGPLETILHLLCRIPGESGESQVAGQDLARRVLEAAPQLVDMQNGLGQPPLSLALTLPKVPGPLVALLIDSSSSLDVADRWGDTALHLLMKAPASAVNSGRGGAQQRSAIARHLVSRGAYIGCWDTANGHTPLHTAIAWHCEVETMAALVAIGFDVNGRTEEGLTPAMVAIMEGEPEGLRLLANAGADLRLVQPRTRLGLLQLAVARVGAVAAVAAVEAVEAPNVSLDRDAAARRPRSRNRSHLARMAEVVLACASDSSGGGGGGSALATLTEFVRHAKTADPEAFQTAAPISISSRRVGGATYEFDEEASEVSFGSFLSREEEGDIGIDRTDGEKKDS